MAKKVKTTEEVTPKVAKAKVKSTPLMVSTHFEKVDFKTISSEPCEECGEKLTKVKWASSDYPDDGDFYGFFCVNTKCGLFHLCQGTTGKPPVRLRFAFKDKKQGVDKEVREVKEVEEA